MTEGFGQRHPGVRAFLEAMTPLSRSRGSWPNGDAFWIAAYPMGADVPAVVVSSIRCLVVVGDRLVVCTNEHGRHPWPGGRREPGETFEETAVREVREETGWILDPASLAQLGWLHLELDRTFPPDHPYPHPDLFQAVFTGRAVDRAGDEFWTDTEGYETSSELLPPDDVRALPMSLTDAAAVSVFLDLLAATARRSGDAPAVVSPPGRLPSHGATGR